MTQTLEQTIYSCMVVWLAGFTWLYGRGGINHNWIRRYAGTAWMMLGIYVFSVWIEKALHTPIWHNWYLSFYPLALGGTVLPYGKGDLVTRMWKRIVQGLAFSVAPITLVIFNQAWWLWLYHIGLCISACYFIGALNIVPNARKNETLIALLCFALVLFMVSKP